MASPGDTAASETDEHAPTASPESVMADDHCDNPQSRLREPRNSLEWLSTRPTCRGFCEIL